MFINPENWLRVMNLKNKTLIILAIALLAFFLRLLVASNLHINADETVYTTHAFGFIQSGRLSVLEQSPVYYYLLNVVYSLFGVSAITSRLLSVISGALSVILIYFILKEFYDTTTGILAAFLLAVSGFSLAHLVEMDTVVYFFTFLSIYFLIQSRYQERALNKWLILGMSSYLISVLIKPLAIPAIVPLAIYYLLNHRKEPFSTHFKVIALFSLLAVVLLSPILTYNFLLYKEKGITDAVFSEYLGVTVPRYEEYGTTKEWSFSYFKQKLGGFSRSLLKQDFLTVVLFLVGITVSIRKKGPINYLLLPLIVVFGFFFGLQGSPNHYIIIAIALGGYAAIGASWLISKKDRWALLSTIPSAKAALFLCATIFLLTVFAIWEPLTEKAATNKLERYFSEIDEEALVIVDPAIYTGSAHWALSDSSFVWADALVQDAPQFGEHSSTTVDSYFIECVSGNCGWGKKSFDQETNKKAISQFKVEMYGTGEQPVVATFSDDLTTGSYDYQVYKQKIRVPVGYVREVNNRNVFFSYPFRYIQDERSFDYLNPVQFFDRILYSLSRVMLFFDSVLAVGLMVWVCFLLWKKRKAENGETNPGLPSAEQ